MACSVTTCWQAGLQIAEVDCETALGPLLPHLERVSTYVAVPDSALIELFEHPLEARRGARLAL